MIRRRPLGVRVYLVAAMMLLAIVSVAVSAVVINRGVDTELREFSQRDLRFSATNAAEMAASAYLEVGGWSERPVLALRAVAAEHGDEVVVLGEQGRPVMGSPATATDWADGERAPIVVDGRQVGTIVATPSRTGDVDNAAERLDRSLQARMAGCSWSPGCSPPASRSCSRSSSRCTSRGRCSASPRWRAA